MENMQKKTSNILKSILQALFVIVIFVFLGRTLVTNWNRLDFSLSEVNYFYVFLSVMFFAIAWIAAAISWGYITEKLKKPLGYKQATKIWVLSQSARYIPGSVWQVFGRVYMGEKKGLGKGETLASVAIETSNLIISSVLIFVISIPFWTKTSSIVKYYPYLGASLLVFGFLHPRIFNGVTNFFVHRLDKKEKNAFYNFAEIIKMLLPYVAVWVIFGLGFYFLIVSFKGIFTINLAVATGIFALSWVIGFLFVIAPGGLGAREIALVYFLAFYVNNGQAVLLSIFSRVLMMVAELIVILMALSFRAQK